LCALALLCAAVVVEGYSAVTVHKLARKNAFVRPLINCYGVGGPGYYPLQQYSGQSMVYYDSTLDVTVVIEFCFSVSVIQGQYSTSTSTLTSGAQAYNGHNYGYYVATRGDDTATYSLRANYSAGDEAEPCSLKPNRQTIVGIQCATQGQTCSTGSCTVDATTGFCVCALQKTDSCTYTIEMKLNCEAVAEVGGRASIQILWLFGIIAFFLLMIAMGLMKFLKKRERRANGWMATMGKHDRGSHKSASVIAANANTKELRSIIMHCEKNDHQLAPKNTFAGLARAVPDV